MMKRDGRSDGFLEDLECWILGLAAKDLIRVHKEFEQYVMPTKQQPTAAAFFYKIRIIRKDLVIKSPI